MITILKVHPDPEKRKENPVSLETMIKFARDLGSPYSVAIAFGCLIWLFTERKVREDD